MKTMFECGLMYVSTEVDALRGLNDKAKDALLFVRGLEYNKFDGKKLATCIEHLVLQNLVSKFRFGREYSPVLYVTVNPLDDSMSKVSTNTVLLARTRHVLRTLAEQCQPDELWGVPPRAGAKSRHLDKDGKWVTKSGGRGMVETGWIRAWWD
jgi:hypothetical protein